MSPSGQIQITENGLYVVTGGVPIARQTIVADAEGDSVAWRESERLEAKDPCRLCRCGQSATKPFCDGSHLGAGFDGTETASRRQYLEQADVQDGPSLTLTDAKPLRAFARFCDVAGQDLEPRRAGRATGRSAHRSRGGDVSIGAAGGVGPIDEDADRASVRALDRERRGSRPAGRRADLGARWDPGRRCGRHAVRGAQPSDAMPLRRVRGTSPSETRATRRLASLTASDVSGPVLVVPSGALLMDLAHVHAVAPATVSSVPTPPHPPDLLTVFNLEVGVDVGEGAEEARRWRRSRDLGSPVRSPAARQRHVIIAS